MIRRDVVFGVAAGEVGDLADDTERFVARVAGEAHVEVGDVEAAPVELGRHVVVLPGIARREPAKRRLQPCAHQIEGATGAERFAATGVLHVDRDERRVDRHVVRTGALDLPLDLGDHLGQRPMEVGARHIDVLLERDHRALRRIEVDDVGEPLGDLAGRVDERRGRRHRLILRDGTHARSAVLIDEREPCAALLTDAPDRIGRGEARQHQPRDDLLAEEIGRAAGVEHDGAAAARDRREIIGEGGETQRAGAGAGDGAVDVEEQSERWGHPFILSFS